MHRTNGRPFALAAALFFCAAAVRAQQQPPPLDVAGTFVVLAGTNVRDTSGSQLVGNVGASPGNTVTVPDSAVSLGTIHRDDDIARQAQRDNASAYADLLQRPCVTLSSPLTGKIPPNVYCVSPPAQVTGTLILDGGDADSIWIFRVSGKLATDGGSVILLNGGAISSHVFWQVGDSAALGAHSAFIGSILALNDITMGKGMTMSGRALAQRGSVTLDGDALTLCCDPIRIEPAMLPNATPNIPYKVQLKAVGGTPPHNFSLPAHPDGMKVTSEGELTWTPLTSGSYPLTVDVTDKNGCPGEQKYVLVVCGTIIISEPSPPTLCPFVRKIPASGGQDPYVFSGAPPNGMTLMADGQLLGTPSAPGCSTFTVTATDALGCTGTREITVCDRTILPEQLPNGFVNVLYKVPILFDAPGPGPGRVPPAKCDSCEMLPENLFLMDCVLQGTPKTSGLYKVTIVASDGAFGTANRTYALTILDCPIVFSPVGKLPDGSECVSYDQTIRVSGGATPYEISIPSPPPGLVPSYAADSVRLTGIPANAGANQFDVIVKDSAGCMQRATYSLTVFSKPTPAPVPPLPCAGRGVAYPPQQLPLPNGGKLPVTFMVTSGALPDGLTLSPSGLISGTPSASAVGSIAGVTMTDALSCSATQPVTICICLTVAPPPTATVGVQYSQQLQASGGSGSYTFTRTDPPDWLMLDSGGTLTGVPPAPGPMQLTIVVTDTKTACTNTVVVPLTIASCSLPISPPSTTLPNATQFVVYPQQVFIASGGTSPYTYAVPEPPMPPPGLTLSTGGVLSGTPTAAGRYHFSVQAIDATGLKGCPQVYTIVVAPTSPPVIPPQIPLLSAWGLLTLSLCLLTVAVVVIRKGSGA